MVALRQTGEVDASRYPAGQIQRALFVILSDQGGGAERVTLSLARHLSEQPGWSVDVRVVCAEIKPSFATREAGPKVRVIYGRSRAERFSWAEFVRYLLRSRYDLVFSTNVHVNAVLSLLRRLRLVEVQRLVSRESTVILDRNDLASSRWIFRLLYRLYGGQDVIIAQTTHMAERVRSWLRPRAGHMVRVVPNPVDAQSVAVAAGESLSTEQAVLLDGKINILFCGRLIPIKRPERALEAFEMAERSAPGRIRLVFLGRGLLEGELRERAARLPAGAVLFLGFESNPYKVMRACHLGVVSSDQEGFPNVILEMMAAGARKIITTPCAGDLVGLSGVTVTRDFSASSLSEALTEAIRGQADERRNYASVLQARTPQAVLSQVI